MRPERLGVVAALALLMAICCPGLYGQQAQKPLTNAGVIKMVKAGLSESVVVATIHASPANFDVSPDGLIALQKARVTQNEMNAMVAATQGPSNGGATAASANANSGSGNAAPAAASGPRWQMPTVAVVQNGASQELPLEKTQLAQTKTKPTSMASLAGDSVMTEGIQAGVGDATMTAATHMSSGVGGVAVEQAGGIFSGALARRKPMTTYVWGVPGPASSNVLQIATPSFTVSFARTPGVNPDDFAPEIVKLTPAQNTCRLIGA
ncbi:MAG: hypothetical protein ACRD33_07390, partial [Candidatus Acidiferrales bacterium]